MTNEYAVPTAMPAGSGIAALSAAPQGIGAVGLPASWCIGAVGFRRPRLVDLGQDQVKPGVDRVEPTVAKKLGTAPTTTRINYNHMTRTSANGEGGSGSQPLREHSPA
jgi:hypothetical protein